MAAIRWIKRASALAALVLPLGAWADAVTTDLFYTTFGGGTNVWKAAFAYDGSGTAAGVSYASINIATTVGADGIVFNPNNGHLLVGGQGPRIHDLPVSGSPITTKATPGVNVFHLAIDPSKAFVYGSGIPGGVAKVGIDAGGFTGAASTSMTISGSTSAITSLAFDAAGTTAFYTTASPTGPGQFGSAVLAGATITTTAIGALLTAAHGMIFDTSTGWLTLFGDTDIAQIDPSTGLIVASLTLGGVDFDQGTSDGLGHLWVASNNGNVTFVDLNTCTLKKISASCFMDTRFLAANLDDLAPLAGLGGCAPNCQTPEPAPVALVLPALAGLLLMGRRRRQQAGLTIQS